MSTRLLIYLVLGLVAGSLHAGLWDSDRPTPEGLPSHYDVIAGRFDRFPPGFYELREQRSSAQIAGIEDLKVADTNQLDRLCASLPVFDDAGVALLRLGRHGDAIILMDRKLHIVSRVHDIRTATARSQGDRGEANKAAILLNRWLNTPNPTDTDLKVAHDILQAQLDADAFNSDARWSLLEINWRSSKPAWQPTGDPVFPNLLGLTEASFRGEHNDSALARAGIGGCLAFLARRIVYEDGWENVDVMYAYSLALALSGRDEEALFAWFRACELIDGGATTGVANAPAPKALKRVLGVHVNDLEQKTSAEKLYIEMRERADAWSASRNKFLEVGLAKGRHPDTDPKFWAAWSLNDPAPQQPGRPEEPDEPFMHPAILIGGFGGFALVLLTMVIGIVMVGRRGGGSAPSVDEL
ncbi:MAG: hypothetical protein KDB32_11500 [Planctomycetes bacterium]|nr:hypothetical protein [Planctomycetota bacterium]